MDPSITLQDELPAKEITAARNPQTLRLVAAFGYLAGALVLVSTVWLPDPDPSDHHALVTIAAAEALLGIFLLAGRRLAPWAIKLISISGAIVVTSVVLAVITPMGVVPLYFLWPAMTSGYFGSRQELRWNFALFCVALAVGLWASPDAETRAAVYSGTVLFYASVSFITWHLNAQVEGLVGKLHRTASVDALTGLLNRGAFTAAFDREIDRARRSGLPLSVVLFDLDYFKLVNDRFGHAAGDACLRSFAELLEEERRPSDIVARIGGEEFTAVLFGSDEHEAARFAERVSERLREARDEPELSTSAGVAGLGGDQQDCDTMLNAADRALDTAKATGRDRVVLADDPLVRPLEQVV